MLKSFNEFDRLFRELEQRSGDDASRIELLVKNSPEGRRLVGSLYLWVCQFDSELTNHRFLLSVPTWFNDRYNSYKGKFGPEVERVYGRLHFIAYFSDEEVDGIPTSEILHPAGQPPKEAVSSGKPYEAAEAVDSMIRLAVYTGDEDDDAAIDDGLTAWKWFNEKVGIDLVKIEERWEKLPQVLVPSHLEKGGAYQGLIDLLDDATRAYVFGLPAAAIAMCRAVCERVIKEFYLGGAKGNLGKLAILAEKEYEHVARLNLKFYIDKSNDVLHSYQSGQLSDEELEVVRRFLETTKTLIERAPRTPN